MPDPTALVPPSRCWWGWGRAAPPVSPAASSHHGQVPGVGLGVKDDAVAHGSIPAGGLQLGHPNLGRGGIWTTPHPHFGSEHLPASGFSNQQVEMCNNSLPNRECTPGICSFNSPHPGRTDRVRAAKHS